MTWSDCVAVLVGNSVVSVIDAVLSKVAFARGVDDEDEDVAGDRAGVLAVDCCCAEEELSDVTLAGGADGEDVAGN